MIKRYIMPLVAHVLSVAMLGLPFLYGCSDCFRQAEMNSYLSSNLQIEAPRNEIELVLNATGLHWSYDDLLKRYNTTVRDPKRCGEWRAVEIYVHLDDEERFTRFELFESYTMP